MTSRKQKPPSAQLGLGILPSTTSLAPPQAPLEHLKNDAAVDGGIPKPSRDPSLPPSPAGTPRGTFPEKVSVAAGLDLESFDDYDDSAKHDDVPRLRLVDPPAPIPRVIVELVGEVFEVSRLRDNGTTVACVMWTRDELLELVRRAQSALEMSDGT